MTVELKVERDLPRATRSLYVATPMYGGLCHAAFTESMIKLAMYCDRLGIDLEFVPAYNESHIDRGRNMLVDAFMNGTKTHLMFIDADIGFAPEDALKLLDLADPDTDKDVVCGFYPKKCINWKLIVEAVKLGLADKNPEILEQFVGDMVFTPSLLDPGSYEKNSIYDLTPLHEGGTGFMMIQRRVFEKIKAAHPEIMYIKNGGEPDTMGCYFDAKVDPDEWPYKRFLTEDYDFCRTVRKLGMKIWLAPWMKLSHYGTYRFIGNVEAHSLVQREKAKQ